VLQSTEDHAEADRRTLADFPLRIRPWRMHFQESALNDGGSLCGATPPGPTASSDLYQIVIEGLGHPELIGLLRDFSFQARWPADHRFGAANVALG
jgi:hypothetical protein